MAKDDYYVIMYKILAYLYVQLKAGEPIDGNMLKHDGLLFNINEKYWTYIIRHAQDDGYIEGVAITKVWGKEVIVSNLENAQITPKGIEYLCNNSLMKKAKTFLKEVKEITPFI